MRFEIRALALAAAALAGCATPNTGKTCTPVASWIAPATRCTGAAPAVAETPPPPAPVETKPEPPPAKVEVKADTIDLKEKIEFRTGSAEILEQSDGVLDEVVGVMKDHPEIKKIRIEGHTDSQGSRASNMKLSDARAAAVKTYLQKHGIAAERMTSKGFGPDKPIADNKTDDGRAQNRRVEIHIVEKK